MASLLWLTTLVALLQLCRCIPAQTRSGCQRFSSNGTDLCCHSCYPGNYRVQKCGPRSQDLCAPCRSGMYAKGLTAEKCTWCTHCVGVQVVVRPCTPTSNTQCGCKEGLKCGDGGCNFCVDECGKGQEPTEDRSCRTCPNGTFNDQIHQKCKPWSTKCANPGEVILSDGDAFTDSKCGPGKTADKTISPQDDAWPLLPMVLTAVVLVLLAVIAVAAVRMTVRRTEEAPIKTPIIRTPTDDPRTLIAIECSFHEAEQEHGSSSESLAFSEASKQLIR